MQIKKIKNKNYIVVKISQADAEYLKGILKNEGRQIIKNTKSLFQNFIGLAVKSAFIMQLISLLEADKKISARTADKAFNTLRNQINHYEDTLDKYHKQFGELLPD